jgi:hypothetical protein
MKDRTTFKRGDERVPRSYEELIGRGKHSERIIARRHRHGGDHFRSDGRRKFAGQRIQGGRCNPPSPPSNFMTRTVYRKHA